MQYRISLKTIKVHLFKNGQYPMFLIWKASTDQYELDDEWVVVTSNYTLDYTIIQRHTHRSNVG
jgi:hypothetical protein